MHVACVSQRLLIGLEYALLVWWTPSVRQEEGFPLYYYAVVLLSYALHQVSIYLYIYNISLYLYICINLLYIYTSIYL